MFRFSYIILLHTNMLQSTNQVSQDKQRLGTFYGRDMREEKGGEVDICSPVYDVVERETADSGWTFL